ncbi:MAG: hypothetical protein ABW061_16270 [Polyangiaceae bacterium]
MELKELRDAVKQERQGLDAKRSTLASLEERLARSQKNSGDMDKLRGDLSHVHAGLLQEAIQLLHFDLAISIQLAQLLDFTLGRVHFAFGSAARKLLARAFDLNAHLPNLAHQITTQLVHVARILLASGEPLLQRSQRRAFGIEPLPLLFDRVAELLELHIERR